MSKARGLADLGNVYSDGALSNRNLIINGAMQVAQRGTSFAGLGIAPTYMLDRWRFADAQNPSPRYTATQSTDAPDGFATSIKIEVTTADSSIDFDELQDFSQYIEAQNLQHLSWGLASAKPITVSFWVKCSVASTMGVRVSHEDGGGYFGSSYQVNSSNTWEHKTITIPANTATALNNDNGRGIRLGFGLALGTNYTGSDSTAWSNGSLYGQHTNTFVGTSGATFQITNVQLEVGDTATPFEHRSYGDELARCQRYYCKSFPQGITPNHTSQDCVYTSLVPYAASSFAGLGNTFPVEMRATPTVTVWTAAPSSNAATGRITFYDGTWKNTNAIVINSATSSTGYYLDGTVTTGTKLVQYNFEADAEL